MQGLKDMYRRVLKDDFPEVIRIEMGTEVLLFKKKVWQIYDQDEGSYVERGLRYGENPDQKAALYELVGGNLKLGDVRFFDPERGLVSKIKEEDMVQAGKHPGKINLTDIDNALNILKFLDGRPACAIMKHNNPSGVAYGRTGKEAFERAFFCDRIAAFGGCVVFTVPFDVEMAEAMSPYYFEVLCAPDFEEEGLRLLKKWKNLRIFKIGEISRLRDYRYLRTVDFESLMDGGLIVQESQPFRIRGREDLKLAEAEYKGRRYMIQREPTEAEMADMLFGWYVEAGVSSNSVLFVKDGATLAIGTGEQDRVGVVDMTIFKAKRKFMDVEVFRRHGVSFYEFKREVESGKRDRKELEEIEAMAEGKKGGLEGSVLVSDGFFPFRDGVDVAAREAGISAIIQPGGSERDYEVIEACNEYGISMVFTGQRLFKH